MSSLSAILANKAAPHTFEACGRTWSVSWLVQSKKAEFEKWLRRQALAALNDEIEMLPEGAWKESYREFRERAKGGAFSFHGELARAALGTPAGGLALARILCGATEDEMIAVMAEKGKEVERLLELVIDESVPDAAAGPGGDGPNPDGPDA